MATPITKAAHADKPSTLEIPEFEHSLENKLCDNTGDCEDTEDRPASSILETQANNDTGRIDMTLVLETQASTADSFTVRNPETSLPPTLLLLKPR